MNYTFQTSNTHRNIFTTSNPNNQNNQANSAYSKPINYINNFNNNSTNNDNTTTLNQQQQDRNLASHRTFKIQDNEIYLIKDSSIKRANEILKKSTLSKPSSILLKPSPVMESNNKSILEGISQLEGLFYEVNNIRDIQDYYNTKMDMKFKLCQNFQQQSIESEQRQKEVNASFNLIKKQLNK